MCSVSLYTNYLANPRGSTWVALAIDNAVSGQLATQNGRR